MPVRTSRTVRAQSASPRIHARSVAVLALLGAAVLGLACSHHSTQPQPPPPPGPTYRWLNDRPVWSPSGRYLLYNHYAQTASEVESLGQYQIWLLDTSTGQRRYLLGAVQPQWLGTDDAFTFALAYVGGIYIYSIGTSRTTGLWTCGNLNFDAQAAPDGRMVALFSTCPAPNSSEIFLVDPVTRAGHAIPATFGGWSRWPAWSPDGSRLAVVHGFENTGLANASVIDTSGNLLMRLTADSTADEQEPTWSRDGTWIYWDRYGHFGHESEMGIWRAHPDGTGKALLIYNGWYPSLAPGDTALAFAKFDSLRVFDIWIADKDGGHQRPLFPQDDSVAAHSPLSASTPSVETFGRPSPSVPPFSMARH